MSQFIILYKGSTTPIEEMSPEKNDEITKKSSEILRFIAKPKTIQQNTHINRNFRKSMLAILLFGFP